MEEKDSEGEENEQRRRARHHRAELHLFLRLRIRLDFTAAFTLFAARRPARPALEPPSVEVIALCHLGDLAYFGGSFFLFPHFYI